MWFLSWLMCDFWSLVFVWSGCLFNSALVMTICSGKLNIMTFCSGKLNGNSGSDCLVFSAHVVVLTRFFYRWFCGKWMGNSVCFARGGWTGSLFCSSH